MAISHITTRGNARQRIYLDQLDYLTFLREAGDVVSGCAWLCHAYCLMPNHFHLLIEHEGDELSRGMHLLNGRYARRFNKRHGRTGHLFEGPYHREPVERDEHLLEAVRYIVLNPVRAKLRQDVFGWPWSSYRATAALVEPGCVTTETLWAMCGGADGFRRFVADGATTATSLKAGC